MRVDVQTDHSFALILSQILRNINYQLLIQPNRPEKQLLFPTAYIRNGLVKWRQRSGDVQGLLVSHRKSARIDAHLARLRDESQSLVRWHMLVAGKQDGAVDGLPRDVLERSMPPRTEQMKRNGGFQGGFLDTLVIPYVLATRARHVWVMEYDVDFSGRWDELFGQFNSSRADLITSTVYPRSETLDWHHWQTARAPTDVPHEAYLRSFNPIMRISRRFAQSYARSMARDVWQGHYEFTLPTAAMAMGFSIEDIGGLGPFCPKDRLGRNYQNRHTDKHLLPGTLVWRPSLSSYFHERPNIFGKRNFLHHPIKPDIENWESCGVADFDADRTSRRSAEGA